MGVGKPLFSPPSLSTAWMFRGEGYWEATRPSSWFWPLGLPHPVCVSTIFALYNQPLYIIKPPLQALSPCAWREAGFSPWLLFSGMLGLCLPESGPEGLGT